MISEGTSNGFDKASGFVYLTGVRQSDDLSKLLFTVVRVGDTSKAVSVDYKISGSGSQKVNKADFDNKGQMSGTLKFAAIDQEASTFDRDGIGTHKVEVSIVSDGVTEGPEGFKIVLTSGNASLGTSIYKGRLLDADLQTVLGTEGNNRLTGKKSDDLIDALGGKDTALGKGGNDVIFGGDGNDTLKGQGGGDHLEGGAGQDILIGGGGNDVLVGGSEADSFVFSGKRFGSDKISDFAQGDKVDLSAYSGLRFRDIDMEKVKDGTLVSFFAGDILFEDLKPADLQSSDFDFA